MRGLRGQFLAFALFAACATLFLLRTSAFAIGISAADLPEVRAAAEHGHVQDQIALGAAYMSGRGVPQDLKLAAYWYEKAAGLGDPSAQNEVGYLYQVGLGVSPDEARAAHWFQLASANGSLDAKVNLGVAYMWGQGVPRSQKLAAQLIREAADKGSGIADAYLGDMYLFGVGESRDQAAAEQWYEKGTRLHNKLAMYRMGVILSQPVDHPRDIHRSIALFRESAAGGFVPAMHSLGINIVNHPELGTPDEALSNLNQAANAGTWKSHIVLGILARDGRLVLKDSQTAYFHFRVAVIEGGETAQTLLSHDLQRLAAQLSADQISNEDKEAEAWTQKHNLKLQVVYSSDEHLSRFPAFALVAPSPGVHVAPLVASNPF